MAAAQCEALLVVMNSYGDAELGEVPARNLLASLALVFAWGPAPLSRDPRLQLMLAKCLARMPQASERLFPAVHQPHQLALSVRPHGFVCLTTHVPCICCFHFAAQRTQMGHRHYSSAGDCGGPCPVGRCHGSRRTAGNCASCGTGCPIQHNSAALCGTHSGSRARATACSCPCGIRCATDTNRL